MDYAIETNNLLRKFDGLTAVNGVSFKVEEGGKFGFLGLNGAGKTTTLRMLTTILNPTSGSGSIYGHDIRNDRVKVRELIGVVFEEVGVTQPDWTPMEYLEFFGAMHNIEKEEIKKRSEELLEMVGLYDRREGIMKTFSSGMKKRIELCRALLCRPKLLFLDEPTKELDIPGKRYVWNLLKKMEGMTIFISSHDIREIDIVCDDVCIIHKGDIIFSGSASELKKGSTDEFEKEVIKLLRGADV